MYTKEEIRSWLSEIADPEIPVVTIEEMGMLVDVNIADNTCEIVLTPTYSGCPAMGIIAADIRAVLHKKGIERVKVKLVYDPAWTTDWISQETKSKMAAYGIAPPKTCNAADGEKHIQCPSCQSEDTEVVSRYGSTACKALHRCNSCKEPFEYFKCH